MGPLHLLHHLADPAQLMVPSRGVSSQGDGASPFFNHVSGTSFLPLSWCRACSGCLVVEPVLAQGAVGGMLLGGCGTAVPWQGCGVWLLLVCSKGLCLGEIPSPALSHLGPKCPGRGVGPGAAGSPSDHSCCPRACSRTERRRQWLIAVGMDRSSQPLLCLTLSTSTWGVHEGTPRSWGTASLSHAKDTPCAGAWN